MSSGEIFMFAGLSMGAYLVVIRAFSDKARATMESGAFGCLLLVYLGVMLGLGWAIDHLIVGVR